MRISKSKLALAMLTAGISSAKELSSASGISVNTISRSNNGGTIKIATLGRIAKALGVDPADIIAEEAS